MPKMRRGHPAGWEGRVAAQRGGARLPPEAAALGATGKDGLARLEFPPTITRKQHYVVELAAWRDKQVRLAYINQTLRGTRVTAQDDL